MKKSSVVKLCPVRALETLLHRTFLMNEDPKRPVFTPINYPYSGLSSSSISKILNRAIELAGLKGRGFSAKSFRPTGATSAVKQGMDPDIVQKTGRWKSQQCFRDHYVHDKPPVDMSDRILLS